VIRDDRPDRRLVRQVFGRTRVPPPPDLERQVRQRLANERRRRAAAGGGWLLGLAGGALALAMVAGLALDSGALQWPAWGAATQAPSAGTLAQPGPAAPGMEPTIVVPATADGQAWRRVDWAGRTTGSFRPPAAALALDVSPDGSLVAARAPSGPGADVLDAGGGLVARLDAFGAWSGDGAHVACALVTGGAAASIVVTDLRDPTSPRSAATPVTGAGRPAPGWTLAGCSAGAGLLVALRQEHWRGAGYTVAEVAVVRMSTGRVVSHLQYPDGAAPEAPVLAPDARHLAENDPVRAAASIRDLLTGEVVGHVTGLVTAFTGDGRLVLTDTELGAPAAASRAALVDWRWRRTIWAGAGHATPLAARPGGGEVALSLAGDSQAAPRTLLVGAGRALDLDQAPVRTGPLAA
jgi:hypothetical protein